MEKKRLVVLFPCPFQGHINPMLQLATILHSTGRFSITVIHTVFNFPNPSKYPDFTFIPISDGLSSSSDNDDEQDNNTSTTSPTTISTADVVTVLCSLNQNCASPLKECLIRILSQQQDEQVACIISDAIMHFTKGVADDLKLPRLALRTSNVSCFVAFAAFPLLCHKGYLPIKESELEALVPELPPLKVKDLPVVKTQHPEILYQLVADMVGKAKASSGLIWNSFESLEPLALATVRKDYPIPVFAIGPFHRFIPASSISSSLLAQDRSCISWLDTQSPGTVLYISFGSIADVDQKDLVEVASGLANSQQHFLWVIRPGLVRGCSSNSIHQLVSQYLNEKMVSERGCIVQWAPQQEVLAHPAVGGFWTHCGWNSTLESICEGVPMLCSPCFADQMVNARYVSHVWRVGLQLEHGLKRDEIESSIRRLMLVGTEREEIMVRVRDLKLTAELCLLKGGSSFSSLQKLIDLILSF